MAITFPPFDPGTPGTLLDSENAKKVKDFIEAWNNVTVVLGSANKVSIADRNIVFELNVAAAVEAYMQANYGETAAELCPAGTVTVLTKL